MKHTIPDSLYVSSNFGPRRRGGRSAAAASRAKKSAITSAQSKNEFLAIQRASMPKAPIMLLDVSRPQMTWETKVAYQSN